MGEMDKEHLTGDELASKLMNNVVFQRRAGLKAPGLRLDDRDMAWWCDAKFGMFIHWGIYAIPADGEWYRHFGREQLSHEDYDRLAFEFAPRHFDAREWVRIAQRTGMRYMVLTARHHDGYALWDSPSSYNHHCSTMTAAKRDFVAEYALACHEAGMRAGLYYSPMDWRFQGYFEPEAFPDDLARMKAQCYGQVEELMTRYGQIDILWYDGAWLAHKGTNEDAAWLWEPLKLNAMVRRLQPKIVISPRSGWEGDFGTDEGGHAAAGPIIDWPWEKCLNLNQESWGFNTIQKLMTRDDVIRTVVNVVGRGGNVLLNVGPDRDGVIPPAHVAILDEVGAWMDRFGKSIYDTRPGPFQPVENRYCSTHRDRTIYVQVLAWDEGDTLILPALPSQVTSCSVMDGDPLAFTQTDKQVAVTVPSDLREAPCTVLTLQVKEPIKASLPS